MRPPRPREWRFVHAYLGADACDQEAVSGWLRSGLNPILHRHGVGCLLVHHACKPKADGSNHASDHDLAYAGLGSSEWANWARAILSLQGVADMPNVFRLTAGKRGTRLRWDDRDGEPTRRRYVAHATEPGTIYWRDATEAEALAAEIAASTGKGGRPRGPSNEALGDMMMNLVEGQPAKAGDLLERFRAAAAVGKTRAHEVLRDLEETGRMVRVTAKLPRGPQYLGLPGEVEPFVADLEGTESGLLETVSENPENPENPTGWKGSRQPLLSLKREGCVRALPAAASPLAETVFANPGGFTDAF